MSAPTRMGPRRWRRATVVCTVRAPRRVLSLIWTGMRTGPRRCRSRTAVRTEVTPALVRSSTVKAIVRSPTEARARDTAVTRDCRDRSRELPWVVNWRMARVAAVVSMSTRMVAVPISSAMEGHSHRGEERLGGVFGSGPPPGGAVVPLRLYGLAGLARCSPCRNTEVGIEAGSCLFLGLPVPDDQPLQHFEVDRVQEAVGWEAGEVGASGCVFSVELVPDSGPAGPSDEGCDGCVGRMPYSSSSHRTTSDIWSSSMGLVLSRRRASNLCQESGRSASFRALFSMSCCCW